MFVIQVIFEENASTGRGVVYLYNYVTLVNTDCLYSLNTPYYGTVYMKVHIKITNTRTIFR